MSKYTKEKLEVIIPSCKSIAEVCRHFKIKESTGAQSHLSKRIKEFGIDTSHFTGQAWNKGLSFSKRDATEYCYKGSKEPSHRLKLKLIRDGYKKPKCESCGIDRWLGEPVILELDHKDSDHTNNELSNLQILCSNCHATFTRQRLKQRGSGEMVETHQP